MPVKKFFISSTFYGFVFGFISYASCVSAIELLPGNKLRLSGFGSLAATHAGSETQGFYREYSQPPQYKDWSFKTDSLLGLQLDMDINTKTNASVQMVGKNRAKNGLTESIEWAFLKYQASPNINLRGGRMGLDIYMLSEYRNVGFAYLWTRPIVEFYTPLVLKKFDGLDFAYHQQMASGYLQYKFFLGQSDTHFELRNRIFELKFKQVYGLNILYETDVWKIRFTAAGSKTGPSDNPFQPLQDEFRQVPILAWPEADMIENNLAVKDKPFSYYSVGVAYDKDGWSLQSEAGAINTHWAFYPALFSAYIGIGKRINNFTPYASIARVKMQEGTFRASKPLVAALEPLRGQLQYAINRVQSDQQTISLGVRWDVQPNLALKAQWDHTNINDSKASLWNLERGDPADNSMDTFSLSLDFMFK